MKIRFDWLDIWCEMRWHRRHYEWVEGTFTNDVGRVIPIRILHCPKCDLGLEVEFLK